MFTVKRSDHNPIISPSKERPWEALSTFNWCPVQIGRYTHCLYRAQSLPETIDNNKLSISSIGHVVSKDGKHFTGHTQFIAPEHDWEQYGCEDPRVTALDGKYYIFYTALSKYPFGPEGIKVAVAISDDLKTVKEKHQVTPFNAKAMSLFPDRINGKLVALLTAHTDEPPAKIAIATFDKEEDMWSEDYWNSWHENIDDHTIDPRRTDSDHVEIGAPPIKTEQGWLLIYSHIQNYFTDNKIFGIEALLLDLDDPTRIIGQTKHPIMVPETIYELYGHMPNIVFPSGSLVRKDQLDIYYGACDTTCCKATLNLNYLLTSITSNEANKPVKKFSGNPIISPNKDNAWESKATFNPAAIDLGGKVHILYRAMGEDNTSVMGYAASTDGFNIDEKFDEPVYVPREDFEKKKEAGNSGCEDARIIQMDNTLYMTYTAFNAVDSPRVALTSISVDDFLAKKWEKWSTPSLITSHDVMNKNTCLMPEKFNGEYMFLHRIDVDICADFVKDLNFDDKKLSRCIHVMQPRPGMWDSKKIGISAPPIKTKYGWLLLYHGISEDHVYRVGAALLDLKDPTIILARTNEAILEPHYDYETKGQVDNVVFPCGAVLRDEHIYIYYGGADSYVAVAVVALSDILTMLNYKKGFLKSLLS